MDLRPIPAFYCCYLLRSAVRHSSLYIGSTPNPARRLAQHNGLATGGAFKTTKSRPWEMACIVVGFPSSIAALQFEWAWQNTHLTRRIADDQRITSYKTITKASRKTGRLRKQPSRPRATLNDKLRNLRLLLRVPSFARWPLEVRFYSEDVYKAWSKCDSKVDSALSSHTKVILDFPVHSEASRKEKPPMDGRMNGIEAIDATYAPVKDHLDISLFLLAPGEVVQCSVCNQRVSISEQVAVVCPEKNCHSAAHMTCVSQNFLAEEGSSELVPVTGKCPKCRKSLRWADLVKEATLRLRGEKEISRLMRKSRRRKGKAVQLVAGACSEAEEEDSDDADLDGGLRAEDVADEPLRHEAENEFSWDDDDDDAASVISKASTSSRLSKPSESPRKPPFKFPPTLDIVIEDSDWEGAEVLD